MSSLVQKFAVDPVWILSCYCDTWRSILFFDRWVQRYAVVSPVEDVSVRWVGPMNILALSYFICPPVC